MKKILFVLCLVLLSLLLACSALAQSEQLPELGLCITVDDDANLDYITISPTKDDSGDAFALYILFVDMDVIRPYAEAYQTAASGEDESALNDASAAYMTALQQNLAVYTAVYGLRTEKLDSLRGQYLDDTAVLMGENSGYTYYRVTDADAGAGLSEDGRARMEASRATAEKIADDLTFIEVTSQTAGTGTAVPSFTAVDMNGSQVTEAVFAQADLTVVNVWATYCNPCISEMPDLAAWSRELPENVQIIGIIVDVSSSTDRTYASAQKILSKSGADFTNLLLSDSLNTMLQSVTGVPTTFFVDRNGNYVHDPVVGAYIDQYKAIVSELLAQ